MTFKPCIRISGPRSQSTHPEPRRGGIPFKAFDNTPAVTVPKKKKTIIRHGLGAKVEAYAFANPSKTVFDVAEHFDTSTAYIRCTERRRNFQCARVSEIKTSENKGAI